jgi:DNA replication regulator SLD2
MEEEKLDAELEILRELEEEGSAPVKKMARGDDNLFAPVKEIIEPARIEVEDSQRQGIWKVEMPLGADGEGDYSTEEDAEKTNEKFNRQRKAWKKKGQKRSTRQVIMRPTLAKWKPEKKWDNEEEDGEGTESTVKETQVTGANVGGIGEESELPDEFSDDPEGDEKQGKEDSVKAKKPKPPRKTSATAHANFRALKIKNKQSKGKRGGKFGRRR